MAQPELTGAADQEGATNEKCVDIHHPPRNVAIPYAPNTEGRGDHIGDDQGEYGCRDERAAELVFGVSEDDQQSNAAVQHEDEGGEQCLLHDFIELTD